MVYTCHDYHDYRDVGTLIDFWVSGSLSCADVLTLIAGYSIDLVGRGLDPVSRYVKSLCCCDNGAFSARYFHFCESPYFCLEMMENVMKSNEKYRWNNESGCVCLVLIAKYLVHIFNLLLVEDAERLRERGRFFAPVDLKRMKFWKRRRN